MQENAKIFETTSHPGDPKTLTVTAELARNGDCHTKIDTSNLNPEQRAKLTMYLIKELSTAAFDKLDPLVGGTAYHSSLEKK